MPTKSFEYLNKDTYYFDSACQSMRPESVIKAELKNYSKFNSCTGRGNHQLVKQVGEVVNKTRQNLLDFLGKDPSIYTVVFTPNTSIGINIILTNLDWTPIEKIITTNKEHNSVLLPAVSFSKKYNKKFEFMPVDGNGNINLDFVGKQQNSLFIFNTTSNVDGKSIANLEDFMTVAANGNNVILLDACQTLAHHQFDFLDVGFDCLFASAHKFYAPSLGFMVIKRNFIQRLDQFWVSGGTIQRLDKLFYEFIDLPSDLHSRLEFGLQDYAAIFGLNEAINWLKSFKISKEYDKIDYQSDSLKKIGQHLTRWGTSQEALYYIESLSDLLFDNLKPMEDSGLIHLINRKSSPIVSLVAKNIDSYTLTEKLSKRGILCRSGYLCCHHYLKEVLGSKPVVRISIGLHNTPGELIYLLKVLTEIITRA